MRTSRASSRCAKNASAPTASWCGSNGLRVRASIRRWNACAYRCAREPRRRSAASSNSKRGCRRRSRRCGPAVTISRATCISRASAHRVLCWAASGPCSRRRRLRFGCAIPPSSPVCVKRSTGASVQSCLAIRVRLHPRSLPANATRSPRRCLTPCMRRASATCCRSPAITWRWWRASSSLCCVHRSR